MDGTALENYFLNREEPAKACLLALRDILLAVDPAVEETIKYGAPCYIIYTKAFVYIMVNRKTKWPYLLFVDGKELQNAGLEQGDRKIMKALPVDPTIDIPIDLVEKLLAEAIDLRKKKEQRKLSK